MKEKFVDYLLPPKSEQWLALAMICYFMEIDLILIQFYRKTTCGRKKDMAVRRRGQRTTVQSSQKVAGSTPGIPTRSTPLYIFLTENF